MSLLAFLLSAKIIVTVFMVSIPFLFLPTETVGRLSGYGGAPTVFYRLYGAAITALLVAYGFGLASALSGSFPWSAVVMGIASNVSASSLMILHGEARTKPFPTAFFGTMGIGFVASALAPSTMMSPLW